MPKSKPARPAPPPGNARDERRIATPVCALARNDKRWGWPLRTAFGTGRFGLPLALTASDCLWRWLPRTVRTCEPAPFLSLRTSDRRHWCGNPFPFLCHSEWDIPTRGKRARRSIPRPWAAESKNPPGTPYNGRSFDCVRCAPSAQDDTGILRETHNEHKKVPERRAFGCFFICF